MATCRRRHNSNVWHWCTNCSNWPEVDYLEKILMGKPTTGELCNECRAKKKTWDCEEIQFHEKSFKKHGGGKKPRKRMRKHPRPRKRARTFRKGR